MTTYEQVKEWRKNNKDKVLEQARRYRKKHPETNKKAKDKYRKTNKDMINKREKAYAAKWRKENPTAQQVRYERWRNKAEAKLWDIAGRPRACKCEICHKDEITVFDHCHNTGKFRGWLCDRCNKTLGIVKDSPELLREMAYYLEKHNGQINNKEKECAA